MTEWNPHNPYDLGIWSELEMTPPSMPDLTEPIDIKLPIPCDSPPRKKPRPSLSLRKNTDKEDSRFVSPSKSLESYLRGYVPKNTDVNTSWAAVADPEGDPRVPWIPPFRLNIACKNRTPSNLQRSNSLSQLALLFCLQSSYKQSLENLNLQAWCMQQPAASPSTVQKWACRC